MTKTKLSWRLGKLPTPEEVSKLVNDKIITHEEAREILFKSEEDRDKSSLEEEIKFLRELVEKLAKSRSQIVEVIREVQPIYYHSTWTQPYTYWCDGTSGINTTVGTTNNFSGVVTW